MKAERVVPVIRGEGDGRRVGSGYWIAGLCLPPRIASAGAGIGCGCRVGNGTRGSSWTAALLGSTWRC